MAFMLWLRWPYCGASGMATGKFSFMANPCVVCKLWPMRIVTVLFLLTIACCFAGPEPPKPASATAPLPSAEVAAVSAKVKAGYDKGSKYMEGRDLGLVEIPEWKGFPTHKWEYTQTDCGGTKRPATVIMLNPSPDQLARWIVRASYDLKQKYDPAFCDALLKHVFLCSGGQFVVRGICLEDMDGDGIHTAYPFRDGVTVKVRGIPGYPQRPLTDAESNTALNAPVADITQFAKRAGSNPPSRPNGPNFPAPPPWRAPHGFHLLGNSIRKPGAPIRMLC
jgi:hypothetical protein